MYCNFIDKLCGAGNLHLFQIVNPPEKEASFDRARGMASTVGPTVVAVQNMLQGKPFKVVPTEFVYHGSKIGCWHSIIRNSLKNLSNTNRMTSGAAYGAGIYLGAAAHTSLQYVTKAPQTWAQSGLGK